MFQDESFFAKARFASHFELSSCWNYDRWLLIVFSRRVLACTTFWNTWLSGVHAFIKGMYFQGEFRTKHDQRSYVKDEEPMKIILW